MGTYAAAPLTYAAPEVQYVPQATYAAPATYAAAPMNYAAPEPVYYEQPQMTYAAAPQVLPTAASMIAYPQYQFQAAPAAPVAPAAPAAPAVAPAAPASTKKRGVDKKKQKK